MWGRCRCPATHGFANYGGAGIAVCERWRVFEKFLADMGERPAGTSLDRIENAKGYEPGNCRWATAIEQARNRRTTLLIEHRGERLSASEWARRLGMTPRAMRERLRKWSLDEALSAPKKEHRHAA